MATKSYRVTLSAMAYVTSTVVVEVDEDELDEDGLPPDHIFIEDQAISQAEAGEVDWELDSVDDDTITLGTIRRSWSE